MSRNTDAERDCSTVLGLKPGHVKALYRRAQARIELQKRVEAKQGTRRCSYLTACSSKLSKDLLEALKHEPNNTSIKAELQKLDQAESSSSSRGEKKVREPKRRM